MRVAIGTDASVELLVDTGSSYVVLTPATFRALNRESALVAIRKIRGAMAGGEIVTTTVYRLPSLSIGPNCELDNVEAVVLPGATRGLLGLSALSRLGTFSMRFEPPSLRFNDCGHPAVTTASL